MIQLPATDLRFGDQRLFNGDKLRRPLRYPAALVSDRAAPNTHVQGGSPDRG